MSLSSNKITNFFANYGATIAFVLLVFVFYQTIPFYVSFFDKVFFIQARGVSFHSYDLFVGVARVYLIGLIPYYIYYPEHSTFRQVLRYIGSKFGAKPQPWSDEIKQLFLKLGVKFFFAPLMIFWLTDHCVTLINNLDLMQGDFSLLVSDFPLFFTKHLFWNLFSLILFLDVFFFTVGYMTERDVLDNKIKSVQPYAIGWIVALLCYPPFNQTTSSIIQRYSTDLPHFDSPWMTVIIGLLICLLMAIYTWASVALGWKASNLTNRGIISHGPYQYIRHPAYVCKNMAWTLGALPVMIQMFEQGSRWGLIGVICSLGAWWGLYYARALTEEMHLSEDPTYQEYVKKVRYRYIPGLR